MSDDIFDLDDKRRLNLGLAVRENIVHELTKGGELPRDTSGREFLLRAIEGMDDTIFKKAKIKTEDKLQEAQQQIAGNIAELLKRVSNNKASSPVTENPKLGSDIQVENPVDGETHVGVNSEEVRKQVMG